MVQYSNSYTPPGFSDVILWILLPLICISNVCIIIAFLSHKALQKHFANYFICSYACTDMLVGALLIPGVIYRAENVIGVAIMYTTLVYLITLAVSSYHGCLAFRNIENFTRSKVLMLFGIVWFVPFPIALIPLTWVLSKGRPLEENQIYVGIVIMLMLILSISTVTVYSHILRIAYKMSRQKCGTNEVFDQSHKRLLRDIKFVKLFAVLTISFLAFWIPTFYMNLVDAVLQRHDLYPPNWFTQLNFFWFILSSFLNPFIVCYFQKKYRRVIKQWFMCAQGLNIERMRSHSEGYESID